MLIFNLCEILATLNFSQSEEKIREGGTKYFSEKLSFAYTNKAAAKILVIYFLIIVLEVLSAQSSVKRLSTWAPVVVAL